MKYNFKKFFLLVGSAALLSGCATDIAQNTDGVITPRTDKEVFVDPLVYETPEPEVYYAPQDLYAAADDEEEVPDVSRVIIHYYNADGKNDSRQIYTWTGGSDEKYSNLVADDDPLDPAGKKAYYHITLDYEGEDIMYKGKSFLNFIVKFEGTWSGQSIDTILDFTVHKPNSEGVVEVWTMPAKGGVVEIYDDKADTQKAKVTEAYFTGWKTIHAIADEQPTKYRLYAYDKGFLASTEAKQEAIQHLRLLKTGTPSGKEFDITFNFIAHINVQYVIETEYSTHDKIQSIAVSTTKLYNDEDFNTYYTYNGDDLGCTYTHSQTTFKVWAPTAGAVILNVYNKGTPKKLGVGSRYTSDIHKSYPMTMQPGGVWEKTLLTPNDDLEGKYYTYTVFNAEGESEVCDPYAKACGLNGKRGMILDFERTNPDGWTSVPKKWDGVNGYDIKTPQELSIYEIHIRDLTDDDSWQGTSENGSFQAFKESGVTLTTKNKAGNNVTVKTGFDHIEELGINTIQIMPVFDADNHELKYYYVPDEEDPTKPTKEVKYVPAENEEDYANVYQDAETNKNYGLQLDYNWGYNPLNYNCVEGSYSSNPEDGAVRVQEYKELIQAYATNANHTRVVMDVVYNHVSSAANSNFTKLMPGYYFRIDEATGEYLDGSGCSNEVKSEAKMMSKFIVDSLCWWAKEYKIKGFRFDLMGLLDTDTLNAARTALYAIDPDIYLYGEGWALSYGGPSGKDGKTDNIYSQMYGNDNQVFMGGFNDGGRNAIRGSNDSGNKGYCPFEWTGDGAPEAITGGKKVNVNVGGWTAGGAIMAVHSWGDNVADYDYAFNDSNSINVYNDHPNFLLARLDPAAHYNKPEGGWSIHLDDGWHYVWNQSQNFNINAAGVKSNLTFHDWGDIKAPGRGFMSGDYGDGRTYKVGQMMIGRNTNSGASLQDPRQTVNYASCHDNYTLYDQLSWGLSDSYGGPGHEDDPRRYNEDLAPDVLTVMLASTTIEVATMMSNGVAFMLGGEELFRSKVEYHPENSRLEEDFIPMYGTKISHNSYKSTPETNAFDWNRKVLVTGYHGSKADNGMCSIIAKAIAERKKVAALNKFSPTSGMSSDFNFCQNSDGNKIGFYMNGYAVLLSGRDSGDFYISPESGYWDSSSFTEVLHTGDFTRGAKSTLGQYAVGVIKK